MHAMNIQIYIHIAGPIDHGPLDVPGTVQTVVAGPPAMEQPSVKVPPPAMAEDLELADLPPDVI